MANFSLLKDSLEENVLSAVIWNDDLAAKFTLMIKVDLFSTRPYQKVARAAYNYYEKFGRVPAIHIYDLLEADLRRGQDGIVLRGVLDSTRDLAPQLQPEFLEAEVEGWLERRHIAIAIEKASDALDAGKTEEAKQALYGEDFAHHAYSPGTWLHDSKQVLSFLDTTKEEDYFSSGIDVLDKWGIRPQRKTMMLFIAPKGRGKSWWCCNIGKAGLMYRHTVLHITLEMSEEKVARRYVQAMWSASKEEVDELELPHFKKLDNGSLDGFEFETVRPVALVAENRKIFVKHIESLRRRPRLLIKQFPTGELTVAQLKGYLDYLKRKHNFVPSLLIVDYPDLMDIDPKNLRVDTGRTFIKLRGLAVARNMALVIPTQSSRESDEARRVRANMVAEDWSKITTADDVVVFSQTEKEYSRGLARLYVDFARESQRQQCVLITQSYPVGQFCLDSVPFTRQAETQVKEYTGEDDNKEESRAKRQKT